MLEIMIQDVGDGWFDASPSMMFLTERPELGYISFGKDDVAPVFGLAEAHRAFSLNLGVLRSVGTPTLSGLTELVVDQTGAIVTKADGYVAWVAAIKCDVVRVANRPEDVMPAGWGQPTAGLIQVALAAVRSDGWFEGVESEGLWTETGLVLGDGFPTERNLAVFRRDDAQDGRRFGIDLGALRAVGESAAVEVVEFDVTRDGGFVRHRDHRLATVGPFPATAVRTE